MSTRNEILYDRGDNPGDSGDFNKGFSRCNQNQTVITGPKWRAYKEFNVRKKSFYNAEKSLRNRAGELAKNGFYYKGYGHWVICFFCGIEVDARGDHFDSYTSHKEQAPQCQYIQNLHSPCTVEDRQPCQQRHTSTEHTPNVDPQRSSDMNEVPTTPTVPMETEEDVGRLLTCKVCLFERVAITFQPCGHLAACSSCASQLSKCPVCRAPIRSRIKTYLS